MAKKSKPLKLHSGKVLWGKNCILGKNCTIGYPRERSQSISKKLDDVIIKNNVSICNNVVIYEGTMIESCCYIDDFTRIGYSCSIGHNARITYGAFICDRVKIDHDCVIAGFICDATVIGANCTIMGNLVHKYASPKSGWWDIDELSPRIGSGVVIGYNANVIGGISIGDNSYVAAGATVTNNVPEDIIVVGINKFIKKKDWHGKDLMKE